MSDQASRLGSGLLSVSAVWVETNETYEIHVDHPCIPFTPFICGISNTSDAFRTLVALQDLYAAGYREGQRTLVAKFIAEHAEV